MATGPTPARKGFSLSMLPKTNIKSTVKYIVNPISKAKQIRVKGNFLSLLFRISGAQIKIIETIKNGCKICFKRYIRWLL